jgi:hypothetical protein
MAGATYTDGDGRVCWKPEAVPTILATLAESLCVGPPQPDTDPRSFVMQRAGTEGMPSVGCEPALAAELADPSRRAFVTFQALWPYEPFIDVTTMPTSWDKGMFGSGTLGAYLAPGVAAAAPAPGEQPVGPAAPTVVPVWKQALTLGGLGVGLVGLIWLITRGKR